MIEGMDQKFSGLDAEVQKEIRKLGALNCAAFVLVCAVWISFGIYQSGGNIWIALLDQDLWLIAIIGVAGIAAEASSNSMLRYIGDKISAKVEKGVLSVQLGAKIKVLKVRDIQELRAEKNAKGRFVQLVVFSQDNSIKIWGIQNMDGLYDLLDERIPGSAVRSYGKSFNGNSYLILGKGFFFAVSFLVYAFIFVVLT